MIPKPKSHEPVSFEDMVSPSHHEKIVWNSFMFLKFGLRTCMSGMPSVGSVSVLLNVKQSPGSFCLVPSDKTRLEFFFPFQQGDRNLTLNPNTVDFNSFPIHIRTWNRRVKSICLYRIQNVLQWSLSPRSTGFPESWAATMYNEIHIHWKAPMFLYLLFPKSFYCAAAA